MDIASQSLSGELGNTQGVFICLVPFFALGVLGVALIIAPASLWKKIPAGAKLIGTLLVGILAVLALCPACLFYFQLQNARTDPSNYGFGYLVKVEYGFWITVFGLFVALVGGILGMGASAADLFMKKKDTQGPPVAG